MSIRMRAILTDSAVAFLEKMTGSAHQVEEVLMLAELIAHDRDPRTALEFVTVQLADMLLAHDSYWSRLGGAGNGPLFAALRAVWEEEE